MPYPKWKYRKHPTDGYFQQTLVAHEQAEAELDPDWSDDPASTGYAVRPVTQLHPSHFTDGHTLHEVITDASGAPTEAVIEEVLNGDISHV